MKRAPLLSSFLGLLLLVVTTAQARQGATQIPSNVEIPEGYAVVQHIIRPGDTFSEVTSEYLGSAELWEINELLNPEALERELQPGERLLMLIDPERVPLSARVRKRAGDVEAQANPLGWLGAEPNDLLIEKDAARTRRNSSTELLFHDGTSVVVSEESLVFIRQLGRGVSTVASNRTTQRVEILEGQADLSSLASNASMREDVEVVMGSSTLRLPKEAPVRTRTAIAESGASKVGMYQGAASFVASSGGNVDLAEGEGLVAVGAAPPKKEKLLAAPPIASPPRGARLVAGRLPSIEWQTPGDGAVSYTVEVCRDRACGDLVTRTAGVASTSLAMPDLNPGFYYARVTAASASGLDGYPSEGQSFEVVTLPPDSTPPEVSLDVADFGVPFQGLRAFGPDVPMAMSVSDEGSGVDRAGLLINGSEQTAGSTFSTGRTTLAVFAVDRAGQRTESQTEEFFVDADAPTLSVSPREAPSFERRNERPKSRRKVRKARAQGTVFAPNSVFALHADEPIGYSLDRIEWRPLAALETGLLTNSSTLQLVINDGYCLDGTSEGNSGERRCGRTFLEVNAGDAHTGVKQLSAVLNGTTLLIEAEDEVGNVTALEFTVSESR